MANRIYILPLVTELNPDGVTYDRHPKYIFGVFPSWACIPYGAEAICVCKVLNISASGHDALVLNSDVMALPEDIDQLMSVGAVIQAQAFLESLNIPANWINTTRTYRQVIKVTIGLFQFVQRWSGLTNGSSPFKEGMNLTTQYNNMSALVQARLRDCFDTLNIDRASLTATSTIREALIVFGQEFVKREISLAGEIL